MQIKGTRDGPEEREAEMLKTGGGGGCKSGRMVRLISGTISGTLMLCASGRRRPHGDRGRRGAPRASASRKQVLPPNELLSTSS